MYCGPWTVTNLYNSKELLSHLNLPRINFFTPPWMKHPSKNNSKDYRQNGQYINPENGQINKSNSFFLENEQNGQTWKI